MRVTDIRVQQKHQDRFSIFIDGKYSFSLLENQLRPLGIKINQELTDQDIAAYKRDSDFGKALDAAYRYLSYRPRSSKEVSDMLLRKYQDQELTSQVLENLSTQRYIDDHKFSRAWVRERQDLSPRSVHRLRAELIQKGINSEIISEVLSSIGDEDQIRAIQEIVNRKRLNKDDQKTIQYLSRQGFRYGQIKKALDELF